MHQSRAKSGEARYQPRWNDLPRLQLPALRIFSGEEPEPLAVPLGQAHQPLRLLGVRADRLAEVLDHCADVWGRRRMVSKSTCDPYCQEGIGRQPVAIRRGTAGAAVGADSRNLPAPPASMRALTGRPAPVCASCSRVQSIAPPRAPCACMVMALPRSLLNSFSPMTLRTATTMGASGPLAALLPILARM